jgi:putative glutamine amidotransferase
MDHSTPTEQNFAPVRIAKAHAIRIAEGAQLAAIVGRQDLSVNSLHNQGIARLAPGLAVEATAPDGTIEAVRVEGARGFALGVQWHPEYDFETDSASRAILGAFAGAVARYVAERDGLPGSRIAAE